MGEERAKRVGDRLRLLRESMGLSQAMVADRSQTTQDAVCHIEKGQRISSSFTLQKIAISFGLSLDDLLCCDELSEKSLAIHALIARLNQDDVSVEQVKAIKDAIDQSLSNSAIVL